VSSSSKITWSRAGVLKRTDVDQPREETVGNFQRGDRAFFFHPDNNKYYFIRSNQLYEYNPQNKQ